MFLGERGAVYSFTRLLKPVVKHARLLGWKRIVYVNDFDHIGATEDDYNKSRKILKDAARRASWLCSEAKEHKPATCFRFRGYNLNTQTMKFEVTEDKLEVARKKLRVLLEARA